MAYKTFRKTPWRRIKFSNPLKRLNKAVNRRSRVTGVFLDPACDLRLVGSIVKEMHDD